MEKHAPANPDVIESNRELFASADHLGQLLGSSSGTSNQLVRLHDGRIFLSVAYINDSLSSFSTDRIEIVNRPAEAGHGSLALRLVDRRGDEVPTQADLRLDEWALHSSPSSEDGQQLEDDVPGPSFEGNHDVARHDTRFESDLLDKSPAELTQGRSNSSLHHTLSLNNHVNDHGEADDIFVESTIPPEIQPRNVREETSESENEADTSRSIILAHPAWQYDETIVQKLRELKLTDMATLTRLLENRSPFALNPLSKTRDHFVHLCTLADGTVFSVKMFRDLHAHSEKLEFASLNDPALLDRPLTGYQKNELAMMLRDILPADFAQQLWSSAHSVPRKWREDYRRIIPQPGEIQRKLFYEYATMEDFKRELERLVMNVERFHGSNHEVTAAAERTVREISIRMDDAAAVGIFDTQASSFHGLVREVSFSEAALSVASDDVPPDHIPRFVIPLGHLHTILDDTQPPTPNNAIILVDVSTPSKAIWLYENSPESCYLVMLTDDIMSWKPSSGRSGRHHDGGLMKRGHADTRRTKLTKEHRASRVNMPIGASVLFKRASKTRLAKAIKEGWAWAVLHEDLVTPTKRPRVSNGGSSLATPKNKRVYAWDSDEDEEWVPATEHRKSKKTSTPRGRQSRTKAPRTV